MHKIILDIVIVIPTDNVEMMNEEKIYFPHAFYNNEIGIQPYFTSRPFITHYAMNIDHVRNEIGIQSYFTSRPFIIIA